MRCPAIDGPTGYRCTLSNHHDGPHSIFPRAPVSDSKPPKPRGNYDPGRRRRSRRDGRERGCWVYIPGDELRKAGIPPSMEPPWYRIWGGHRGGVVVRLYRSGGPE